MTDSIVFKGDYGTGDNRAREARLKKEKHNNGRHHKYHNSLNTAQINELLLGWGLPGVSEVTPEQRWGRLW